ncbi:hypothetical protein ACFL6G_00125 [candidate division KSB1 bacterium]
MYLTAHASAGLLLGVVFPNPAVSFTAGFVSHFVLDMIPHEHKSDLILEYPTKGKGSPPPKRRVITFFIDLAIVGMICLMGWYLSGRSGNDQLILFIPVFAGISGSVIPDFVLITVYQWDNKFLRWYFEINNRLHFIIPHSSIPRKISITYQVIISIVFLYLGWIFF